MEDMLSFLLTLAIIILSIVAKVKKNQKKAVPAAKKAPVQQASPAEIPRAAAPAIPVQQAIPVSPMPAPAPMKAAFPAAPKAPAPARMGPEGEDACHEYMLDEQRPAGGIPALQEDEQQSEAARDLVRGVIIGEILRRPAPRRYGRQA